MSDAQSTASSGPRPKDRAGYAGDQENEANSRQTQESEQASQALFDSFLEENQTDFSPNYNNRFESGEEPIVSDQGNGQASQFDFGRVAREVITDSINNAKAKDGPIDLIGRRLEGRSQANHVDSRYLSMLNGDGKSPQYSQRGLVEKSDGSSYTVGEDGHIASFTHAESRSGESLKISDIKHDKNGYLESYTDQKGFQFKRISPVDEEGYGSWQASTNGHVRNYGGTGTSQFRAKMVLDQNGLSKLIGDPKPGQASYSQAGKMYWRDSSGTSVQARPENNEGKELVGLSSVIDMPNGDKFNQNSSFDAQSQKKISSELTRDASPKIKMDTGNPQEIEISDGFELAYNGEDNAQIKMKQTDSANESDAEVSELEITNVAELFGENSLSDTIKQAAEIAKDTIAPYVEPVLEVVGDIGLDGGMLDRTKTSVEAGMNLDYQDKLYSSMQTGVEPREYQESGTVEQSDGSSYSVSDAGKIETFTFASQEEGQPEQKLTDIKYDSQGNLSSYVDQHGYTFRRSSDLDENGYGIWQTSKGGRQYNYGGTETRQFRAKMQLDENGLSKLIGKPLPGQPHDDAGKLYTRRSDGVVIHSAPEAKDDGTIGSLNSEVTLGDGSKFTRSSSAAEDGALKSNLDLAEYKELTPEELERKEKVEEIKDKIESLEDPILELTNAFKKFEQIGGLEITQAHDGSYKADLEYRGPSHVPPQFNGPVTYKRGRPVWSQGMSLSSDISFNFRPTGDGIMVDRMSGVKTHANWRGINASGPQNWMQLGKCTDGTPYMKANTTTTGSAKILFWNISKTENNTNMFTASDFKHGSGMREMLSDSSAIDGLNGALKLFESADISRISMSRPDPTKPGDFNVNVGFGEEREIKLDEKLEGPLELDSIKLAKDLTFQIRQGEDGSDQDRNPDSVEIDASGITANIQIGSNESRLLKVQPQQVRIAKNQDGEAVLQMQIGSEQLKRLESAQFEVDLNDLDKVKSGKVNLVNVPLLQAFSGAAIRELTRAKSSQ